VLAEQVDVGLDRNGLARGGVEVGRHARGHDEVGVEADQHELPAGAREPPRLPVERRDVGEVLVDQAAHDEVIGASRQAAVGDEREHLRHAHEPNRTNQERDERVAHQHERPRRLVEPEAVPVEEVAARPEEEP